MAILLLYCAVTGGDGLQRALTKSNNICNKKYKQHMAY